MEVEGTGGGDVAMLCSVDGFPKSIIAEAEFVELNDQLYPTWSAFDGCDKGNAGGLE